MAEYNPVNLDYLPDALLIYCSDGRFHAAHEKTAEHHELKSESRLPDRIVIPGPSYSIVEEPSRSVILPYIEGLVALHGCTELSITDHLNCGWMGANVGGYKEADESGKIKLHSRYLRAAAKLLNRTLDNVKVETHLVGPDKEIVLTDSPG